MVSSSHKYERILIMTEQKKALIVDLNNVWNKYLYVRKGSFPDTVSAILYLFRSIYREKEFHKIYVVIDGKPCEKYEEFKEYKSNRKHNPDKYIPMKVLSSVLSQYFTVVGGKYVEGDEVIGYLATRLSKNYDTYIYSNDKDFLQLMQYGIKIVTNFKKGHSEVIVSEEEALNKFKNKNGEPLKELKHILPYRVFKGDSSDGIPSACKGMFDKVIRDIIENYWIYDEPFNEDVLLRIVGRVQEPKVKNTLVTNINNIIRNYKLTDISHIPNDFKSNIQKIWYKLDTDGLNEYVRQKDLYQW